MSTVRVSRVAMVVPPPASSKVQVSRVAMIGTLPSGSRVRVSRVAMLALASLRANAGADLVDVTALSTVRLDGTASTPGSGSIVDWEWTLLGTPPAGTVLTDAASSNPQLRVPGLPVASTLTVQLRVKDGSGSWSSPDTLTVGVRPAAWWIATPTGWAPVLRDVVPAGPPGFTLVKSYDFVTSGVTGSTLDNAEFYVKNGFPGSNGVGTYSSSCVSVVGGIATITPAGDTIGGFDTRYHLSRGRIEWRQRNDVVTGYKATAFAWPANDVWTFELDAKEDTDYTGAGFQVFFHDATGTPATNRVVATVPVSPTVWHDYALTVMDTYVSLEVDGIERVRSTDPRIIPPAGSLWKFIVQQDVGDPSGANHIPARIGYPAPLSPPPVVQIDYLRIYIPA